MKAWTIDAAKILQSSPRDVLQLDDVWDQVPASIRDKHYADFRSDYDRGFEELCSRLGANPPEPDSAGG